MKFIKVTLFETEAPAWLNPALIEAVQPRPDGGAFIWVTANGSPYEVEETADVVLKGIKAA